MREKLIELLSKEFADLGGAVVIEGECKVKSITLNAEKFADYLISHGVTFADVPDNNVGDKDNNVPCKWIPVSERRPEPFVSVLVQMPDEEPCPTVHEGYLASDGFWYAAHFVREPGEVTHWMPMPEPPKEGG